MIKIVQILLFIISYSPLYLILFFQNLNDDYILSELTDLKYAVNSKADA